MRISDWSSDVCSSDLVPGTVLNGTHHERLRQHDFLTSDRPVPFDIAEIWQVAPGTFNYPGAALVGHKKANTTGLPQRTLDRKRVVSGKRVSVRVDIGGRR